MDKPVQLWSMDNESLIFFLLYHVRANLLQIFQRGQRKLNFQEF
jgi:hypothetical protein